MQKYIDTHYDEEISLEDLSRAAGYNKISFGEGPPRAYRQNAL